MNSASQAPSGEGTDSSTTGVTAAARVAGISGVGCSVIMDSAVDVEKGGLGEATGVVISVAAREGRAVWVAVGIGGCVDSFTTVGAAVGAQAASRNINRRDRIIVRIFLKRIIPFLGSKSMQKNRTTLRCGPPPARWRLPPVRSRGLFFQVWINAVILIEFARAALSLSGQPARRLPRRRAGCAGMAPGSR